MGHAYQSLRSAESFGMGLKEAKAAAKQVSMITSKWRETGTSLGAPAKEIERMASQFEHRDLKRALAL
jgi:serine/threonine-protein kinase HipA